MSQRKFSRRVWVLSTGKLQPSMSALFGGQLMLERSRHGGQTQPHVSGYPPDGPTSGRAIDWRFCGSKHIPRRFSQLDPAMRTSTHQKGDFDFSWRFQFALPLVLIPQPKVQGRPRRESVGIEARRTDGSYNGGRLLIVSVIAEGGGPFEKEAHIFGNGRMKQVLFCVGFGSSSERETRADFECGVARGFSFVHSCCMRN
jgi:hypothetical protein